MNKYATKPRLAWSFPDGRVVSEAHNGKAEVRGDEDGHDPAADVGEDEGLVVADVVGDELHDDATAGP